MGFFGMFKGESGAGKSVGALSFPNPIVLDHDRKMPAIARKHFPGKEVKSVQFKDVLEVGKLLEEWQQVGCPFETIIGDSITSLSYSCLKTLDDLKGQNILKMMENVRESAKKYKTVELRGYDYYNAEDNFIKFYIDALKALWMRPGNPRHVILIAHVMTSETQDIQTKEIIKTRRIVTAGSKIAAYIPAQMDEVWHFGIERGSILSKEQDAARIKHFCVTESMGEDYAKTAFSLDYKIDFTNGSLYENVRDQIEGYHDLPETQPEIISKPARKLNF